MDSSIVFCLSFFIIIGLLLMIYAVLNKEREIPKGDVFIWLSGLFIFTLGILIFANYDTLFANVENDSGLFYESAADSIYNGSSGDEDNSQPTDAESFN